MTGPVFVPERLRLARELSEWSQADLARQLRVTPAAVSQFESGVTRPSADVTNRMAQTLNVPNAFFTVAVTDTHDGFFRSLRRTSVAHRRRARALAHVAHDLAEAAGADILPPAALPRFPVNDLKAPREHLEQIASDVRQELGLPRGPISNVVALLEQLGVVVIRLPLDTADVDAFSLPFPDRPVVVLGAEKDDKARSRFDAAHELGHLIVHGDQVWGVKEVEQQAHAFAAEFLMPAAQIYDELPTRADWPRLFELKRRWQVSLAALLMRAKTLQRMSEPQYLTAIKAASARGWKRVEPVPLGRPEQPKRLAEILQAKRGRTAAAVMPRDVVAALADATAG